MNSIKMLRRLIISALASGVIITAGAQINSSDASGYLTRGYAMYADDNPSGAVDQLTEYFRIVGSKPSEASMEAGLCLTRATLRLGRMDDALRLARNWLETYPYSPRRAEMKALIAECIFISGNYAEALDALLEIDPDMLTGEDLAYYWYRRGYSLMKLGEYEPSTAAFASIPDYAPRAVRNAGLLYRGYIAFTLKNYAEAGRLFEAVDPSIDPGQVRDFYLSQIAFIRGDYDTALSLARKAATMDLPEDISAENLRVIGESLYFTGHPTEAVNELRRYIAQTDSPARSALYILGLSQYEDTEYSDAIRSLRRVTSADDAMAQSAYLYIGQAQLKLGDNNAAILAFDKALRMNHDPAVQEAAFYNYAVARIDGASIPFGSSVGTFEEFLRRYPSSRHAADVAEYIVNGYISDDNYEKALSSISKIKNPSTDILRAKQRVLYMLGARDLAAGRIENAESRLTQALELASFDNAVAQETRLLLADCHYRSGHYAKAAEGYRNYLRAEPNAVNAALARYDLGYALFAQKDFKGAISQFEFLTNGNADISPSMKADAFNRIGDAHYYESDFRGAVANYSKADNANPEAADYALFQTAIMQGFLRDYSSKEATLNRMIERFPTSALIPSAMLEKAENCLVLSRPDEAMTIYSTLVERYPSTEQGRNAYLQLAMTLENRGDTSGATEAYRNIVKRYPSSDEAKLAAASLRRIYADAGNIQDLADFLSSIPGAPVLDPSDVDNIAFDTAEQAFTDTGDTSRLKAYLDRFPSGANTPRALGILAEQAYAAADYTSALEYADRLIRKYPDNAAAESAFAIKGEVELSRGRGEVALEAYKVLATRASSPQNLTIARMGIMRVSRDLGHWNDVLNQAQAIGSTSVLGDAEKTEATFSRGLAYRHLGQTDKAIKELKTIASKTDELYGARAAVALGEIYFEAGQMKNAKTTVQKLTNSRTPHQYWLARGFILLSDINRAQGNDFEADEYLNALKENYPGNEADIFTMIEERLK